MKEFKGHQGRVLAIAFSPDGSRLYSVGNDQTARIWNVAKGSETRSFTITQKPVRAFLTADCKKWTMIVGTTAFTYDADSGKPLKETQLGGGNEVSITSVSADGRYASVGGQHNTVRVCNLASGQQVSLENGKHTYASTLSPDGALAVTGGGESLVRLWNVANQKVLFECKLDGHIYNVAVSRDGKRFLGFNSNKRLHVWNATANDPGQFFDCPFGIGPVAFSADGRYVQAAGDGGVMLIAVPTAPPASTPTSAPAATSAAEKGKDLPLNKWVEINSHVDIDQDLVRGHWHKTNGSLSVEDIGVHSRLRLPVLLKNCSYDWRVDFRVGDKHDEIHFLLPIGERIVILSLDGYGGETTGLTLVKKRAASEVSTSVRRALLAPNSNNRMEISVRLDKGQVKVTMALNGVAVFEHVGASADLSVEREQSLGTNAQPGLMVHERAITYVSNQVRIVEGNGAIGRDVPLREPLPARILNLKPTSLTSLKPKILRNHEDLFAVNQGTRSPLLNNKECNEFLFTHAPTTLQYEIPAKARYFTAVAYAARHPAIKFIVRVDGKEMYSSKNEAIANVLVEIPPGSTTLELECDPLGDVARKHSCWCYPAFR